MKTLVTGATGFTGSHLVKRLIKEGHAVKALIRKSSKIDFLKDTDVELFYGDVTDRHSVFNAAEGAEWVFHI
ncbi:MAG: NAD-dependent epimerase/dehydratase family protein, partial [Actinobacteria bacterium]|nr:NAD-dependent epimerase/dehydratase family protein [Actinomycetota bacterium]